MRFVAVNCGDSECLILSMPSLRKIRFYSVLAFMQNKASVGKVLWPGNVRVRCPTTSSWRNFWKNNERGVGKLSRYSDSL
jgi:hypothetical protein